MTINDLIDEGYSRIAKNFEVKTLSDTRSTEDKINDLIKLQRNPYYDIFLDAMKIDSIGWKRFSPPSSPLKSMKSLKSSMKTLYLQRKNTKERNLSEFSDDQVFLMLREALLNSE